MLGEGGGAMMDAETKRLFVVIEDQLKILISIVLFAEDAGDGDIFIGSGERSRLAANAEELSILLESVR